MRLSRPIRILVNYLLVPVLIIWLLFSIYHQIVQQQNLEQAWQNISGSFTSKDWWMLWVVIMLVVVNYGLEAKKWHLLVSEVQQISYGKAYKAVLSGQSFAFNTVNNVGEYFGRIAHLEEGKRLKAISVTIVGSISQFIITLLMGIGGLVYLRHYILDNTHFIQGVNKFWIDGLIYALSAGTIVLLLVYYEIAWITKLLEKVPFIHKLSFFIVNVEHFTKRKLTTILLLSTLRYTVFVLQYIILMRLFKVDIAIITTGWMVCVMFLVLAIIPSIALAELGIRGEISKQIFGLMSTNILGITFSAALIWFINRVLPALAGSLLLAGIKLLKNKNI